MSQNLSTHPLLQQDQYHWSQLVDILQDNQFSEDFQLKIQRLAIASSYALTQLCKEPTLLHQLHGLKHFDLDESRFEQDEDKIPSIQKLQQCLRQFRHRKLIEIIYLDVIHSIPLTETLKHLSDLADLLIRQALRASNNNLVAKHGQPLDPQGDKIQLNLIAMGKLGGGELNFSSDIDLICCYASDGELDGYGRLSYQEFFTRVTRLFTQLLSETTEDGFVYRVDLRLRPWGDSGPVALSHAAIEHYYQLHGREWEQYAMVKARVLTGSESEKHHLASIIQPFVFRKYHDYRVFEGLAGLKDKIDLQASSSNMRDNIKLGYGGIREIEFFVQAFQILKGGRNQQLQSPQIFRSFDLLQSQNIAASETVEDLREAYIFLRQLENKIQMQADQQTHKCPENPLLRGRIAETMGYSNWQTLKDQLQKYRQKVNTHFKELFKRETPTPSGLAPEQSIDEGTPDATRLAYIESIGFGKPDHIHARLKQFFGSRNWDSMSARARKRFSALIPTLLKSVCQSHQQEALFDRLLNLFSSIAGRSAYFELLHQNTPLLEKLADLFDKSEWIAQEVANYPMLLENLIQPGDSANRFDRSRLQQDLHTQLQNVIDDEELELDVLRLFKREQTIVIAVAELSEEISTTDVGIFLSDLAEIVLQGVYELASRKMQAQYGTPGFIEDSQSRYAEFSIIGYGKLGGREMHYQSDLDIIFLHDSRGQKQITQGPKSIDNSIYFARLAQKIIAMTSVLTSSGKLYEIDSRLRPEGSSGLLVSSLKAYRSYQTGKAWTWEHQALVRARHIAGNPELEPEFNRVRKEVLTRPRDLKKLQAQVLEMRAKIYRTKNPPEAKIKNLKHSHGCIVDIEFMVQFWTLLYANKVASISAYSDNIGLLNELYRLKFVSGAQLQLADIYQTYHRCLHETVLQNKPAEIESDRIAAEIEHVVNCWNECFGEPLEKI